MSNDRRRACAAPHGTSCFQRGRQASWSALSAKFCRPGMCSSAAPHDGRLMCSRITATKHDCSHPVHATPVAPCCTANPCIPFQQATAKNCCHNHYRYAISLSQQHCTRVSPASAHLGSVQHGIWQGWCAAASPNRKTQLLSHALHWPKPAAGPSKALLCNKPLQTLLS
jgi:hypothetical protein